MMDNNNFDWDETLGELDNYWDSGETNIWKQSNETPIRQLNIENLDINKMNYFELKEVLEEISNEDKVRLFDRIVEKNKEGSYNLNDMNVLILSLPPEIRLKYVEYYDFEIYGTINEFIKDVTNNEDIFNAAKIALNKITYPDSASGLFSVVPNNKKIEFLKLISKKEKDIQTDIINDTNIADYLTQINIENRAEVIKNIIFKDFQIEYVNFGMCSWIPNVRFNPFSYVEILSVFSDEESKDLYQSKMFETFTFLAEESKKIYNSTTNEAFGIVTPERIVKMFYECGHDPNKIIEFLIKEDLIDNNFGLCDIITGLPVEVMKDSINFIISLDNEKRKITQYEFFSLLDNLPLNDASEFFVKYCLNEKKFDYLTVINRFYRSEGHSSFDYLNIIFEKMSPEELINSFEKIKIAFSEITTFPKYDEKYNLIVSVFSKKYNVDEKKLLSFIENFGYNILKYLENETISKFINTDGQFLERLFALFTKDTIILNKSVTNDILNSLLQRQFMLEEHEVYNIFSRFENLVQNNKLENINELLEKIFKEFDYSSILEDNNSSRNDLYNKIIKGNLDLLHIITDRYIAYKREMFLKEKLPKVSELLSMEKIVTRESYKSEIIKNNGFSIARNCQQLVDVEFTAEQRCLIDNEVLMWKLLEFKKDPKGYVLDKEYKKYLKVLNELLDIMYDNKVDFINYNTDSIFYQHLNFELVQREVSKDFLIGILLESNYEGVINLLSNTSNYESLKAYLERYKIICWQDTFSKLMAKGDIYFDEGTAASLISNYDKIKPYIDNKASLTSIIDYANCYSAGSNFYRMLFGLEDYNLLAANAGKNKASMSKTERLNGCRDLIPLMYAKKSFTIPTVDENFTLSNGNNIRIVLGNATNMINLTYGERTEACMRKGGAFNSLFEHCAIDKNGFHMRFVNPKNGNFVSRVSGTRNGNTVFLNELRNSLDEEYSNEDLYEAIKMISKYLVQLSRDSELPIDNVIVTSDYALKEHQKENQNLNLSPEAKKEAFREISFNFTDSGILLASSKKEGELVPYIFNDNAPLYDSIRDDVKVYHKMGAVNRIIQIRMINDMINGVSPEDINTEYVGDLPDYVVSGEDYYIAYSKENVNIFVLDSCKENPRTISEINNILKNNTDEFGTVIPRGVSR